MSFIYSIKKLFSKIAYYLNRLSQALNLRSLKLKKHAFLNFVENYVRKKES